MTVSIRRMSLGAGFEYLMKSVARGDGAVAASSPLTRYYAESGTPPGWWLGDGLAGLNDGNGIAARSVVTEEQLWRLLGMLQDPVTGDPLGRRPPRTPGSTAKRIADRTAALDTSLTTEQRATEVARIETEEAAREVRISRPVAAFDLTFSVPKSVSTVWALADADTQTAIHTAHRDAIATALSWAEHHVFLSRTGHAGAVQEPIRGVLAAAFDHWNSRAGDPHLHTHLVIANRAQGVDGVWRTLDSRTLHKYVVALSELHEGVLQDLLTERLGYAWTEHARRHSAVPRHDIAGVPVALMEEFSQRAAQIETDTNRLVAGFAATHGRQPSDAEKLRLRQQATLQTRPDKQHHSLRELTGQWQSRAERLLPGDGHEWAQSLRQRSDLPPLRATSLDPEMLDDVAAVALSVVSGKRATFTHANVLAEVHRQLHGARFASPSERLTVADHTTALALSHAVHLNPPTVPEAVPEALRRPDGTSKLVHRGSELFSTTAILDAEQRLLDAAAVTTAPSLTTTNTEAAIHSDGEHPLSPDQAAAVTTIATSGRAIDLLIGPAGTGKTTTLRTLCTAWEHAYGPGSVVGLAPSAAAAKVLADGLGITTENTAKWLHEHARTSDRDTHIAAVADDLARCSSRGSTRARRLADQQERLETERARWSLHTGQLVVLDEASLADTASLDALTAHATQVGAKLLLVGDPHQLSPVDAGGALAMLAHERADPPTLDTAHRFSHAWERQASLALRCGDPAAITAYATHDRIREGDHDTALDQLYAAWKTDTDAGQNSLMIAPDRDTVTALNTRARTDRILTGHVTTEGVPIAHGVAGEGDVITTRRNNRTLTSGQDWVRNGDTWTVTSIDADESLTAQRHRDRRTLRLPADYVREHVELGYASTAHRAQGRTVDTAHALVTANTTREALYVAATRGRQTNTLHIVTDHDPDQQTQHGPTDQHPADTVLQAVLDNASADTSAHAALHHQQMEAASTQSGVRNPTPWIDLAHRQCDALTPQI